MEDTSWNRGPLFFVQQIIDQFTPKPDIPPERHRAVNVQNDRSVNARRAADVTALVPQRQGLFVRRSASLERE